MKTITHQDVISRDNIHIYEYAININGIRSLEFCAIFLFAIAALIYPFTDFDPWYWAIVPIVLGIAGIFVLIITQYWRIFAKKAFLAYDDEFLFVSNDRNKAYAIPWNVLDVKNSGLADPKSGANLKMSIDGETVRVRLFTPFVCIPKFDVCLATILTHIQENEKKKNAALNGKK